MDQQFCILINQSSAINVNLNELCRLCGSNTQEQSRISIFDSSGMLLNLKYKIANCLQLTTNENDILPKVICFQCANNLEQFYEFKINCEKASQVLLNLFHAKEESINQQNVADLQNSSASSNFVATPECIVPSEGNGYVENLQIKIEEPEINDPLLLDEQPNTSKVIDKESLLNCSEVSASATKKNIDSPNNSKKHKKFKNKPKKLLELTCNFCSKTFVRRKYIYMHIQRMHLHPGKLNIKCQHCNKLLKDQQTLGVHIKTMHTKQFCCICDFCGKGFQSSHCLEVHVRARHTKDRPFKCQSCNYSCASKYSLKYHVKNKHNDNPRIKCDYCDKTFANKRLLKIHRIKHEIPLEKRRHETCSICGAGFSEKTRLKIHIKSIHGGERPFECDQCDKCYNSKNSLDIHKLTHTGKREHVCEICGSAFALLGTLKIHRTTVHEGLKMYKCNDCDKSYTQNQNLNIHLKKTGHTKIKKGIYTVPIIKK